MDIPEDAVVILCSPTSMPHVENVTIQQCHCCNCDVWLAETTKKTIEKDHNGKEYYLMCISCSGKVLKNELMQFPTDEQIKDVADHVGEPFDIIKARIYNFINLRNKAVKFESN
jgi:hypothetical protein